MPILVRTTQALDACESHLSTFPGGRHNADPQVVAYLTGSVVVLMCSEVEQEVERLILQHVTTNCGGSEIAARLVRSTRRNLLRNAKYSEICKTVSHLGAGLVDDLKDRVNRTQERAPVLLGNIVAERDGLNHGIPKNVSYGDLRPAHAAAEAIVLALEQTLR